MHMDRISDISGGRIQIDPIKSSYMNKGEITCQPKKIWTRQITKIRNKK